jgi:hypothetical protein
MEYFHMISANQSYPPYDINILQFNQSLLGSTWGDYLAFISINMLISCWDKQNEAVHGQTLLKTKIRHKGQ